ncbi:hypothetical protein ACTGJ9_001935 [Bradyrhizobium sp. RDM12]
MIVDPAIIRSANRNLNANVVRPRYPEAVGCTRLKVHHVEECGVVNAAISMFFGLEDIFGRAKHLAAMDKVTPAKLVLNDFEIDIQGPVHATVPPTNRQQPLYQPDCPNTHLLPYRAALHTSIAIAITIVPSLFWRSQADQRLIAEKASCANNLREFLDAGQREDGIPSTRR